MAVRLYSAYNPAEIIMNRQPFLFIKLVKSMEGYKNSITELDREDKVEESTIFMQTLYLGTTERLRVGGYVTQIDGTIYAFE